MNRSKRHFDLQMCSPSSDDMMLMCSLKFHKLHEMLSSFPWRKYIFSFPVAFFFEYLSYKQELQYSLG